MSRKTRWTLFIIAVVVFLVASYGTVVYALGYKYDFDGYQFVQTGSLRVVANTSAEVYVNGKRTGETSFLGNSFSRGRLLPRTYEVQLVRAGYHPWKKNIEIEAGYFTDFPKVVLLPLELAFEPVASSSFGFPAAEDTIRGTKGKSLAFDKHTVSVEWLENTDYQPFHRTGDFETVFGVSASINDAQWYHDHEHLLVAAGGKLYFYEIDHRGGINSYELTTLENGQFFYDRDENMVYKLTNGKIVRFKL